MSIYCLLLVKSESIWKSLILYLSNFICTISFQLYFFMAMKKLYFRKACTSAWKNHNEKKQKSCLTIYHESILIIPILYHLCYVHSYISEQWNRICSLAQQLIIYKKEWVTKHTWQMQQIKTSTLKTPNSQCR